MDEGVKIVLNNGLTCLCSKEDFNHLSQYKWRVTMDKKYATTKIDGKYVLMHRLLLNDQLNEHLYVDHINNNGFDNRRSNIRVCTPAENSLNRRKRTNVTSKYLGVSYTSKRKKYSVSIRANGKTIRLGVCENEVDAAQLFDIWTIKQDDYKDGFRKLNFPENEKDYMNGTITINRNLKKPKLSKYYGVYKNGRVYTSKIIINGKRTYIKYSKDQKLCAKEYDKYVVENKLDRKLNFPEDYPDYKPVKVLKIKNICEFENGVCKIKVKDKIILIDEADYDLIKNFALYINSYGYVQFPNEGKSYILSRYLLDVKKSNIFVDHINNDRLDNRRSNLRLSNYIENSRNRFKNGKNKSSKYMGVSYRKDRRKYTAIINLNKKSHKKSFEDEKDAARYRDLYILKNVENPTFKFNFEWNDKQEREKWENIYFK